MKKTFSKSIILLAFSGLMVGLLQVPSANANLVYLGYDTAIDAYGFGKVDNILTLDRPSTLGEAGLEGGRVYWNGSADNVDGGTRNATYPGGENVDQTGGTSNAKTQTLSLAGFSDASELGLIFDVSETGTESYTKEGLYDCSVKGTCLEIEYLALTVWSNDGSASWTAQLAPVPLTLTEPLNLGVGHGDFLFALDAAQAASLNAFVGGAWANYRIGMESWVNWADDGPDTFFLAKGPGNEVPEPATMLLFGTGLIGLAGMARRKRN